MHLLRSLLLFISPGSKYTRTNTNGADSTERDQLAATDCEWETYGNTSPQASGIDVETARQR